mmetsp:Transcript_1151/g.3295  ORF Transcript_1151/g.3295 Transcript_1151/m.3295 type:complete len:204 (+) Transcript_1151:139-750(+)
MLEAACAAGHAHRHDASRSPRCVGHKPRLGARRQLLSQQFAQSARSFVFRSVPSFDGPLPSWPLPLPLGSGTDGCLRSGAPLGGGGASSVVPQLSARSMPCTCAMMSLILCSCSCALCLAAYTSLSTGTPGAVRATSALSSACTARTPSRNPAHRASTSPSSASPTPLSASSTDAAPSSSSARRPSHAAISASSGAIGARGAG